MDSYIDYHVIPYKIIIGTKHWYYKQIIPLSLIRFTRKKKISSVWRAQIIQVMCRLYQITNWCPSILSCRELCYLCYPYVHGRSIQQTTKWERSRSKLLMPSECHWRGYKIYKDMHVCAVADVETPRRGGGPGSAPVCVLDVIKEQTLCLVGWLTPNQTLDSHFLVVW